MKENMLEFLPKKLGHFAMAAPINCEWKMCRIRFLNNLVELGIIILGIQAKVKEKGMSKKSGPAQHNKTPMKWKMNCESV